MTESELALTSPQFSSLRDRIIQAYKDQIHISSKRDTELYKYRSFAWSTAQALSNFLKTLDEHARNTGNKQCRLFGVIAPFLWQRMYRKNPSAANWEVLVGAANGSPDTEMQYSKDYLVDKSSIYFQNKETQGTPYARFRYWAPGAADTNDHTAVIFNSTDWCASNMWGYLFADAWRQINNEYQLPQSYLDDPDVWLKGMASFCDYAFSVWVKEARPTLSALLVQEEICNDLTKQLYDNQRSLDDLQAQAKSLLVEMNVHMTDDELMSLYKDAAEKEITTVESAPPTVVASTKFPIWMLAAGAVAAFVLKGKK